MSNELFVIFVISIEIFASVWITSTKYDILMYIAKGLEHIYFLAVVISLILLVTQWFDICEI